MLLGFCRYAAWLLPRYAALLLPICCLAFVEMQLSFCKDSLKKSLFPTFSLLFPLISLFAVSPKCHSYASQVP